jgi:hypothetical protein
MAARAMEAARRIVREVVFRFMEHSQGKRPRDRGCGVQHGRSEGDTGGRKGKEHDARSARRAPV